MSLGVGLAAHVPRRAGGRRRPGGPHRLRQPGLRGALPRRAATTPPVSRSRRSSRAACARPCCARWSSAASRGARCASACATAGVGYTAVASPIVAEDARVGVVILLVESSAADERLIALQREIAEPVGELRRVLDELLEQTGGRRDERYRTLVEEGSRALGARAEVERRADGADRGPAGRGATRASFDARARRAGRRGAAARRVRGSRHRARGAGSGAAAAGARRRRARRASRSSGCSRDACRRRGSRRPSRSRPARSAAAMPARS